MVSNSTILFYFFNCIILFFPIHPFSLILSLFPVSIDTTKTSYLNVVASRAPLYLTSINMGSLWMISFTLIVQLPLHLSLPAPLFLFIFFFDCYQTLQTWDWRSPLAVFQLKKTNPVLLLRMFFGKSVSLLFNLFAFLSSSFLWFINDIVRSPGGTPMRRPDENAKSPASKKGKSPDSKIVKRPSPAQKSAPNSNSKKLANPASPYQLIR